MPRVKLISDESKPPLIPAGFETAAKVGAYTYDPGMASGRQRTPAIDYTFELISQNSLKGDDGIEYPLQGRKLTQRWFLTDRASFRLEPLLIATDSPHEKLPIEGQPKQFTLDFDTDSPVGKIVWIRIGIRDYTFQEKDENGIMVTKTGQANTVEYQITKPPIGAVA